MNSSYTFNYTTNCDTRNFIHLPDGRTIQFADLEKGKIDGVEIISHVVHSDRRGWLMEIYRDDWDLDRYMECTKLPPSCSEREVYTHNWQVYSTAVYKGVVKAFHCHQVQNDYVTCVHGKIWMVLVDTRKGSDSYLKYMEIPMGGPDSVSVLIPSGVWHGWMGLAEESVVVNIPDNLYNYGDPDEERMPPHSFYDWRDIDG